MTDLRLKTNISSGGGGSGGVDELSSESYLNGIEEELNRRVDLEIELMRSGMLQLVNLTQITNKDHYNSSLDSFQSCVKTESIIKSAHSLLSLAHNLKLLHLFNDESTKIREEETTTLEETIKTLFESLK